MVSYIPKLFSYLFVISFFTFAPYLGQLIWPSILSLTSSPATLFFYLQLIPNISLMLIVNSTFYLIYHLEHPFFEQYKANTQPWPWNQNK